MQKLQYNNVWNILDVGDALRGKMEAAILPNPNVFTWVKAELSACQSLSKREDSDVVEKCNLRSCSQEGWHKGNFFYASKVRGDDFMIFPKKDSGEFIVFFARMEYPPYDQTGYVFSTDDFLVYILRLFNAITLLREWAAFYTPDETAIIENALNWFYKTRICDNLPFNISELCSDLYNIIITKEYIDTDKKSLTLQGSVFLLEHNCNLENAPHPLPIQNISEYTHLKDEETIQSKANSKQNNIINNPDGYTVSELANFVGKELGHEISQGTARNILRDAKISKIGQRVIGKNRPDVFPRMESEIAGKKYAKKKSQK